jgi:anthranilate synthase component 2
MTMKKILVIDNYDSFTYNLVHYIGQITGVAPDVYRNDEISLQDVGAYDKILLSPGPGIPVEAGICLDIIRHYSPSKSILGICLGVQAIGEAFGGRLVNLSQVYHGLSTPIILTEKDEPLFKGLPATIKGGRYHSWVVDRHDLPACLAITALDDNGLIMGLSHREYDVRGLQFHPESVLTEHGFEIMRNWVSM